MKPKRASVTVKIYARKSGFPYFRLDYHLGGERKQTTFTDLDTAKREAETKASQLSRGDVYAACVPWKQNAMRHSYISTGSPKFRS